MQSCKLPIEVCERVIDCLALSAHNTTWGDYSEAVESVSTLYACSLVCRDWVYRSQHHLFRFVSLRDTRGADAFLSTLARHPHRAQLVQILEILPCRPASLPKSVSPDPPPDSPAHTSSTISSLPSNSPAPSAFPLAPSSSHSPPISVSVSNDQPNVEETLPQSESGNFAHTPTSESSEFDVSLGGQSQDMIEEETYIPPCYYNWIYQVLTRLPPLLVNLSILDLDNLPTLHPRFIRLISRFKTVQTLVLSDLENQSFNEIIQVINRLPQLRFIYFQGSKWDRPVRFFPSHPLRLEGFSCYADKDMSTDILDWLGSLRDLSKLHHLQIPSLQSPDRNKVYHILQRCMHLLTYLDLQSSDVDIFGSLSLSSHPKLECLEIGILSSQLQLPNDIALFASRISQLLSPSLVYFVIGYFDNLDLESLATSQSSWKDIDDALGQPKFNRLAYFVMNLSTSHKGNIDYETLRATFQNILPQSYQRGILWVGKYFDSIDARRAFHIYKDDEREFDIHRLGISYYRI